MYVCVCDCVHSENYACTGKKKKKSFGSPELDL